MTSDETTIEKQLEKSVFQLLNEEELVKNHVKRLEVVVLRESHDETKLLIYGQMKPNLMVDTARVELELIEDWKENANLPRMAKNLTRNFLDSLEMAVKNFAA